MSESFLHHVEYLYYEQLAGRIISPANLDGETWTALVAWHRAEKQFERRTSVNLDLLIQALRQQQK